MIIRTSFVLKVFAIIFWYLTAVFLLSLVSLKVGKSFLPIRGDEFRWDFEAMFGAIYVVWGIFLWRSSKSPEKHALFINFTIWANIAHAVTMTIVGTFRPGEFYHLFGDSIVLFIPAVVLLCAQRRRVGNP